MKILQISLVLLKAVAYGADVRALHTINDNGEDQTVLPQINRNGWVNPEDIAPMPQCIAQQDQSVWLDTMTRCTSKRCTSHFGVICTHHQWLTELSCLSVAFSPDVIESYFPFCGRSILTKAQLYQWIRSITGRTWLVEVGDANGIQNLSPASLTEGYATVDVIQRAPDCLTGSGSALSNEAFQHVIASCGFTSTGQHTGNAARPWEYRESLHSMIALDTATVGYDLVQGRIKDGEYFDKACFCSAFTLDLNADPCSRLELTQERLWLNATCGTKSLPEHWTDKLQTTEFAYIPVEDWRWPACVADMPKEVIELADSCETDACEIDSNGYCETKRAVDRACICRSIRYESCGGSCQIFETRISYINWLYELCGNVPDWRGLPDNWHQLAAPTPLEMVPWQWTVRPSSDSDIPDAKTACASNDWKLRSLALVNLATFLAAFLIRRTRKHQNARGFQWHLHPSQWLLRGTVIAAVQLLANWVNVSIVQNTSGYGDVPVMQLMLLWSTMPRPTWMTMIRIGLQPFRAIVPAALSLLFAEVFIQSVSSYYMLMTVKYGQEHNFYLGRIAGVERGMSAQIMYAGALMWLVVVGVALVELIRAIRKINRLTGSGSLDPKWHRDRPVILRPVNQPFAPLNETWSSLKERLVQYWMDESVGLGSERTALRGNNRGNNTVYGTFSSEDRKQDWGIQRAFVDLYAAACTSMFLLWIAQWLFWGGFIYLSSEEFCPPKLGILTAVWVAFSVVGVIISAL